MYLAFLNSFSWLHARLPLCSSREGQGDLRGVSHVVKSLGTSVSAEAPSEPIGKLGEGYYISLCLRDWWLGGMVAFISDKPIMGENNPTRSGAEQESHKARFRPNLLAANPILDIDFNFIFIH